ncbi:hypothetical protein EBBID32_40300 [Sphingobium indicum BiD32]|uniref:Microcin J25-processing protein McjB C-terminal domain-containing protein n=1 Tax=Sphingobium indicum BiD32 TaxID=1301087 RepID=N1MRV1_9SPHN|nr:hypothetical protein EBBID32_40300 [Sphingobium indicum BiD32]
MSFCVAGGRHFFLDRVANRYFALADQDQRMFACLTTANGDDVSKPDCSMAVIQLLVPCPQGSIAPCQPRFRPTGELGAHEAGRFSLLQVTRATFAYAVAKVLLRRNSLAWLLDDLARRKAAIDRSVEPEDGLVHLALAFEALRSFIGQDQCLPLSIAYARCAYARGYRVEIVFGVTPRPFGAHCWVQQGGDVLNDRLARVEHFTPIYAQ